MYDTSTVNTQSVFQKKKKLNGNHSVCIEIAKKGTCCCNCLDETAVGRSSAPSLDFEIKTCNFVHLRASKKGMCGDKAAVAYVNSQS